jgi:hypothetical protein
MQLPIINGIYSDSNSDYRTSYPVNLVPVPKSTGVSQSYLKPAPGIVNFTTGLGNDRGGINVNGICYRVSGSKFISIAVDGTVTVLGEVGGIDQVSLCYSFDNIGICSNGDLFYWNLVAHTLTQIVDVDLGISLYVNWLDGYFVSTDGTFIVVSDIQTPTSFNPLKYGASEVLPDPILSLLVLRNKLSALNRYGIESFENIGGQFFPFQRIDGAYIQRGTVGRYANCIFEEQFAFLGGGVNEPCAVWLGLNAQSKKISTREIDIRIQAYSEVILATVIMEARVEKGHRLLYVHLPNETLVYDAASSEVMQDAIWYTLSSHITGKGIYKARNFVWAYDKWIVGDPESTAIGEFDWSIGSHYGAKVGWSFQTQIIYNQANAAIIWEIELIGLSGNVANVTTNPVIISDYSVDNGITWSLPRERVAGRLGQREKRLNWIQQAAMNTYRIQRFYGNSDAHLSFSALEVRLEGCYY